jgi:hypothetical protein
MVVRACLNPQRRAPAGRVLPGAGVACIEYEDREDLREEPESALDLRLVAGTPTKVGRRCHGAGHQRAHIQVPFNGGEAKGRELGTQSA